jgi:hypothetical protein
MDPGGSLQYDAAPHRGGAAPLLNRGVEQGSTEIFSITRRVTTASLRHLQLVFLGLPSADISAAGGAAMPADGWYSSLGGCKGTIRIGSFVREALLSDRLMTFPGTRFFDPLTCHLHSPPLSQIGRVEKNWVQPLTTNKLNDRPVVVSQSPRSNIH